MSDFKKKSEKDSNDTCALETMKRCEVRLFHFCQTLLNLTCSAWLYETKKGGQKGCPISLSLYIHICTYATVYLNTGVQGCRQWPELRVENSHAKKPAGHTLCFQMIPDFSNSFVLSQQAPCITRRRGFPQGPRKNLAG